MPPSLPLYTVLGYSQGHGDWFCTACAEPVPIGYFLELGRQTIRVVAATTCSVAHDQHSLIAAIATHFAHQVFRLRMPDAGLSGIRHVTTLKIHRAGKAPQERAAGVDGARQSGVDGVRQSQPPALGITV